MRKSISILLLFIAFLSCSRQERDSRLVRVARIVSDHPREAISILDNISYDELSSSDKHYYDFLSIKANDKAYITHKDDSLILDVIKYYSGHEKDTLYAEALYYGGRVYSDMGDYPTALNYFQKSLDQLKAGSENLDLKSRVLSQTGRLLSNLRLYKEAFPYLEETLTYSLNNKDSITILFDLQLLGETYRKNFEFTKAELFFNQALAISMNLNISRKAWINMYLADLKLRKSNIDSALLLIRNCPEIIDSLSTNKALSIATRIYLTANIPDTAFYYAKQLIEKEEDDYKTVAYKALLSPEMINYLHRDSIVKYVLDYRALVEKMYNENSNKLALEQRTHYNYQIQERERIKAEKSNRNFRYIIILLVLFSLLITVLWLWLKNEQNKTIIKLRKAIDDINKLKYIINKNNQNQTDSDVELSEMVSTDDYSIEQLKDILKDKLITLYQSNPKSEIPLRLLQSKAYMALQSHIDNKEYLSDNSYIWEMLESEILKISPDFKTNLTLLLGGSIKKHELYTAILVKYGVTTSQMAIIFGRSKSAIVSRRKAMSFKTFDQKLSPEVIDNIIRIL